MGRVVRGMRIFFAGEDDFAARVFTPVLEPVLEEALGVGLFLVGVLFVEACLTGAFLALAGGFDFVALLFVVFVVIIQLR